MDHLLALGHRAIGYLGAANRPRSNWIRLTAYRDALRTAGIAGSEAWIKVAPPERRYYADDVADGLAMLPELARTGVTAVCCYNDTIAIGALLACRRFGIAVPEQLSIIGCDDVELAQYVAPPLTSIHQPKLRLGEHAMRMVLDLVAGRPVQNQVLTTNLVVRNSTGAPRAERLPLSVISY